MLKNNEIVGDCINDLIIKDKIKNINNFEIQNHPDQKLFEKAHKINKTNTKYSEFIIFKKKYKR